MHTPHHSSRSSVGGAATARDRRIAPRWEPDDGKQMDLLITQLSATVRNESDGGVCLQVPMEAQVEMGQEIQVNDQGAMRLGRVCWTTMDEASPYRLVGMAWVEEADSAETSLSD